MITANADHPENYKQLYGLKDKLCSNLLGQYLQLDRLLNKNIQDRRRIHDLLDNAAHFIDQSITKEQFSRLDYFSGVSSMQEKNYKRAEKYFRECIRKWPHPDNPAREKLDELINISRKHS